MQLAQEAPTGIVKDFMSDTLLFVLIPHKLNPKAIIKPKQLAPPTEGPCAVSRRTYQKSLADDARTRTWFVHVRLFPVISMHRSVIQH